MGDLVVERHNPSERRGGLAQVHINASSNPALRGGFFVNIEESRSGEVRELPFPKEKQFRCARSSSIEQKRTATEPLFHGRFIFSSAQPAR